MVIFDKLEPNSIHIKDNIVKTMQYMKKDITILDLHQIKDFDLKYRTVITTFENFGALNNLDSLNDYVNKGGNLFLAERPIINKDNSSIFKVLGINNIKKLITSNGIKLTSNILINGKELSVNGDILSNSSLELELNNNSKVLAISSENIPLFWSLAYGNGNVMVYNGTSLNEKTTRGLISGALGLLSPQFIYPIINSKIAYIDDFPAPVPDYTNEDIKREYDLNVSQFL